MTKSKTWALDELEYLYVMKQDAIPYRAIAAHLGRSVSACKNQYLSTDWTKFAFYDAAEKAVKNSVKQEYKQKSADARERTEEINKVKAEIIADAISLSVKALPEIKIPQFHLSKKRHTNEDVGLMISDTHIGHYHTLEETGGISEYNVDIFRRRCRSLVAATKDIFELHSQLYDLPTLHLFALGDIVAGMNHAGDWSHVYINTPIYDQMILGFEAFTEMIGNFLTMFKTVNFYGIAGNHARGAPKGLEKDYVNWDFLCYQFLEARFKDNPRVKFKVPKSWWMLERIKNKNFLLVHGDEIKGAGDVLGKMQRYEQKMTGIMRAIPDYTLCGHYHRPSEITTNNGRILINGSFLNSDVFSLKSCQAGARPEQKIFGIHERRGITWTYNLDLEYQK
jgi:hypothetical protein